MTAHLKQMLEALCGFEVAGRLPVHVTISADLYLELTENHPASSIESTALLGVPFSVSPHMGGIPWLMKLQDGSLLIPHREERPWT